MRRKDTLTIAAALKNCYAAPQNPFRPIKTPPENRNFLDGDNSLNLYFLARIPTRLQECGYSRKGGNSVKSLKLLSLPPPRPRPIPWTFLSPPSAPQYYPYSPAGGRERGLKDLTLLRPPTFCLTAKRAVSGIFAVRFLRIRRVKHFAIGRYHLLSAL